MKLTVLVDNNTYIDRYFVGEPAVSYLIEEEDKRILFDVGYSDAFIRNSEKMRIDLRKLDYVALSHGHNDHTWGLDPLIRMFSEAKLEQLEFRLPTIIAHPDVFYSKLLNGEEIGSLLTAEKITRHFKLEYTKKPVWLTEKLVFLGEIERTMPFEADNAIGQIARDGEISEDYLLDDSALVYKAENGLVIIVACSHSGICNTIEYAKKVCGDDRILDIIGGFHLLNPGEYQMNKTVEYFQTVKPKYLHACHCTDLKSKIALSDVANVLEVGVGLTLEFR
ncbi:MBL fold metallo-hydrolase [Brevibacillus brevis]|uniref:MBL fold metallo-hydrolase n=1 Tax=Brevibacillus brevis TaxID=1393 RepID=A0A517I242_BREBE|nr:MBL fold metallo-hydrolase [Brevibacillus brevis]QDS32972.1 MBL fold metallo-hydrolase [Brevibacillus brevis]